MKKATKLQYEEDAIEARDRSTTAILPAPLESGIELTLAPPPDDRIFHDPLDLGPVSEHSRETYRPASMIVRPSKMPTTHPSAFPTRMPDEDV